MPRLPFAIFSHAGVPTRFLSPVVTVLLTAVLLAFPAASDAAAGERESHLVGGTEHRWIGSDRCRGAKLQADRDAVLLGFDILLRQTSGVDLE